MAVQDIVLYPDSVLTQRSDPVGETLDGIEELVRDMTDTMYAGSGAGLAAPQIGVLKRVYIVEASVAGGDEQDPPMVFIDPEIIEKSREMETSDEGCLSFPGIFVPVKRHLRVKTRARDINGEVFEVEGDELFARAMQHELDHLDGRLLVDNVGRIKRKMIKRKMERERATAD